MTDKQTGQPIDARISIEEGQKPLIAFYGKDAFFTELDAVGELKSAMPPGRYVLKVSAGGGFTEAQFVLRSELAAGVDVAFLSDHDSVVNNDEMRILSKTRGVPFISATELSPSWGHFNAYPLDDGVTVNIDTGQVPVQEIFAEARRLGADVIAVNHPYSEYGYFRNSEDNAVPGGYDEGFDLVEIATAVQASGQPNKNKETIERTWQLWNEGTRAYLVAGADVHNVWNFRSGLARTYAHIDGDLTTEKFIASLQSGHSYASQGPLVFPEILFGSDISHVAGEAIDLRYLVQAVSGLGSVTLIERGESIDHRALSAEDEPVQVDFSVTPDQDTWYSLVIEDVNGMVAYTNPVWVTVTN